jgi:hypothetical protein
LPCPFFKRQGFSEERPGDHESPCRAGSMSPQGQTNRHCRVDAGDGGGAKHFRGSDRSLRRRERERVGWTISWVSGRSPRVGRQALRQRELQKVVGMFDRGDLLYRDPQSHGRLDLLRTDRLSRLTVTSGSAFPPCRTPLHIRADPVQGSFASAKSRSALDSVRGGSPPDRKKALRRPRAKSSEIRGFGDGIGRARPLPPWNA